MAKATAALSHLLALTFLSATWCAAAAEPRDSESGRLVVLERTAVRRRQENILKTYSVPAGRSVELNRERAVGGFR